MPRIDERRWMALQRAIATAMAVHVPDWTDDQQHDPGIAVLEVMAYLANELVARDALSHAAASSWTSRIIDALSGVDDDAGVDVRVNGERWSRVESLAVASPDAPVYSVDDNGTVRFGDGDHGRRPAPASRIVATFRHGGGGEGNTAVTVGTRWPLAARLYRIALDVEGSLRFDAVAVASEGWSGAKRPRYFHGGLLTADDFADEQSYLLKKHRDHQKAVHGFGVVNGLEVEPTRHENEVTIRAGLALDRAGREITVPRDVTVTVPGGTASPVHVVLEYAERLTDPMPSSTGGEPQPTRIEEGFRILLIHGECRDGIPIGRLVCADHGWQRDGSFAAARAR